MTELQTRVELELFILNNTHEMMKKNASENVIGVLLDMIAQAEIALIE